MNPMYVGKQTPGIKWVWVQARLLSRKPPRNLVLGGRQGLKSVGKKMWVSLVMKSGQRRAAAGRSLVPLLGFLRTWPRLRLVSRWCRSPRCNWHGPIACLPMVVGWSPPTLSSHPPPTSFRHGSTAPNLSRIGSKTSHTTHHPPAFILIQKCLYPLNFTLVCFPSLL